MKLNCPICGEPYNENSPDGCKIVCKAFPEPPTPTPQESNTVCKTGVTEKEWNTNFQKHNQQGSQSDTPLTDKLKFRIKEWSTELVEAGEYENLERSLNEAREQLSFLASKGIHAGKAKTSDKPEPYFMYYIDDGSELDDKPMLRNIEELEQQLDSVMKHSGCDSSHKPADCSTIFQALVAENDELKQQLSTLQKPVEAMKSAEEWAKDCGADHPHMIRLFELLIPMIRQECTIATRDEMQKEMEGLRKDKERLDWLETGSTALDVTDSFGRITRKTVDAAIAKQG